MRNANLTSSAGYGDGNWQSVLGAARIPLKTGRMKTVAGPMVASLWATDAIVDAIVGTGPVQRAFGDQILGNKTIEDDVLQEND